MTPKADELRARVAALDEQGLGVISIAAELGIDRERVDELIDSLDPSHDSWFYAPAPVLEPDLPRARKGGPGGRWTS